MVGDELDRVWRPRGAGWVAGWVLGVTAASLALAGVATAVGGGGPVGSALVVAAVNAAVAAAAWRWGTHPLLAVSPAGVTVRNPVRAQVVPWSELAGCVPGPRGLTLVRRAGPPVIAWAVKKPSLASWTGRRTHADEVAACIEAWAVHGAPDGPDTAVRRGGAVRQDGSEGRDGARGQDGAEGQDG